MRVRIKYLFTLLMLSVSTYSLGCANHPCRQLPSESVGGFVSKADQAAGEAKQAVRAGKTVSVSKSDGSRQCQQDSGIALEKMEKEQLEGIVVVARAKQHDGKIRTSVCGNTTGMMNVYTISESDLAKAERLGFKKMK